MLKKIMAVICSTVVCSGLAIWPKYNGESIVPTVNAAIEGDYYTDEYGVTYRFTIDQSDNTACLKGIDNVKSNLILPSTVSLNGKSYTVTKLGNGFGSNYVEINSVTIPNTIYSIGDDCFYLADNLVSVNGGDSIKEFGKDTFVYTAWEENQKINKGYCTLGKNLLRYFSSEETVDLSKSEFDDIEYICPLALKSIIKTKKLILPNNIKSISIDAILSHTQNNTPYPLNEVEFYDKSLNQYVDLYDVCMSDNKNDFQSYFLYNNYEAFMQTQLCERITLDYTKKAFNQLGIKYIGSTSNTGYNAFEEYQIVLKLYKFIGQNFTNYNNTSKGSYSFKSEIFYKHGILCSYYADMLKYFCDAAGITCKKVSSSPGGGHAWNNVKIGDKWFNIDSCWTWNWSLMYFLTSDNVVRDGAGCHNKNAESSKIKCTTQIGDVNQDGHINSIDASLILEAYSSSRISNPTNTFSSFDMVLCDVDRNGAVNSIDASWVLSYYSYTQTNHDVETTSLEDYMNQNGYYIIAH